MRLFEMNSFLLAQLCAWLEEKVRPLRGVRLSVRVRSYKEMAIVLTRCCQESGGNLEGGSPNIRFNQQVSLARSRAIFITFRPACWKSSPWN